MLHIRLLGGFTLQYAGQSVTSVSSARLQSLLAYLVLHSGSATARQQIAAAFWPDSSEEQARTNLRNLIHQLRQALPFFNDYIAADTHSLAWRKESAYLLDAAAFENCLAGKGGLHEQQPWLHEQQPWLHEQQPWQPVQREMLEQAVEVYTGDLLPGCYDEWLAPARERYRQAFLSALAALAAMAEEARDYPRALAYARRLVTAEPLQTSVNCQLIRLHMLVGDRVAARKAYQAYSRLLWQELKAEPDEEAQEIYRCLQSSHDLPAPPEKTTALVGRKTEWHEILSAWKRTTAGQVQVLLISGEAGIGKTRLVEELACWAALQGIPVASAYCYPAEGNLPFAPVVSWLRAQPLPHLDKIWLAELARLLPEVRQQFSGLPKEAPLREAWQRQRLFEALARALLAQKQGKPRLLILEDIHWCDQDTLEWLHFLFRFAPRAPLLIVATRRSGETPPGHPLEALHSALLGEGKLSELKLYPLSRPETIQLANQIRIQTSGQSLSAAEAGEVYQEAEGNPLFAIEMVRLGSVQPCPEPPCGDWLAVSEKAQSILLRRVRQVSPETREITCLAATIGREFNLGVLREARQESDENLVQAIDELLQRQIIREVAPDYYDFTHDLLRQAVFGGMSTAHRRLLHRRVAEAYRRLDQDARHPRDAEIAGHYERAGLFPQAVQHYQLAAETAAHTFANADAQRYLRRAITLVEDAGADGEKGVSPDAFAGLLERLGDLLSLDGKYAEAQSCYAQALSQKRPAAKVWQSQVYRKISDARVPQNEHALAHEALDQAEQALGFSREEASLEERQERLQVQLARVQLFYWEGRPKEMEDIIQQIEPVIHSIGRVDQQITLLSLQYMARQRRERYRLSAETVAIGRRRLELTERYSDPYELALAQFQYGFGLLWYGDLPQAREWLSRSLDALERIGDRIWQVRNLAYLGIADRKLANPDAVREETQLLLDLSCSIGDSTYYGIGLANQGWLAWRAGDPAQAERLCNEAHQAWRTSGSNVFRCLADWVLLALAAAQNNAAQAVDCAQRLLDPNPFYQPAPEPAAHLLEQALSAFQAQDGEKDFCFFVQALAEARAAGEL